MSPTDLCDVVSDWNNVGCSPAGLKGPVGAPATITRRCDELVAPLDAEKRSDKVLALRTTHDFRGGLSRSVGCNDLVHCVMAITGSPPLGSLIRQSSTPHEPVSSSRDMLTSIPCALSGLRDTVVGTVVESSSSMRFQASTFVANDVLIDHVVDRLDPNLKWAGASTQLFPADPRVGPVSSSRDMLSNIPCVPLG